MPEFWPLKERCQIQTGTPPEIVRECEERLRALLELWNNSRRHWMCVEDRHSIEVILGELERLRDGHN